MKDAGSYVLNPVGSVRSPLKDRARAPRQGNEGAPGAFLELSSDFLPACRGLEVGQRVLVVTWLHEARRDVLEVHPRDELTNPLTGVFATRSSDRPNPIGLHPVTIVHIAGTGIEVEPLEAIDGTPVLDIKPVLTSSAES